MQLVLDKHTYSSHWTQYNCYSKHSLLHSLLMWHHQMLGGWCQTPPVKTSFVCSLGLIWWLWEWKHSEPLFSFWLKCSDAWGHFGVSKCFNAFSNGWFRWQNVRITLYWHLLVHHNNMARCSKFISSVNHFQKGSVHLNVLTFETYVRAADLLCQTQQQHSNWSIFVYSGAKQTPIVFTAATDDYTLVILFCELCSWLSDQ